MTDTLIFSLTALISLIPASVLIRRGENRKDLVFWAVSAAAVAGTWSWVFVQLSGAWDKGFAITLWVTIAASLGIFVILSLVSRQGWRLVFLVAPYLFIIGLLALFWQQAPTHPLSQGGVTAWVGVHIALSVLTYGLVTLAAVAALGAFLQERALKRRKPTTLTHQLPSVTDCESLLVRLLLWGEGVLGLGLITGIGASYTTTGTFLTLDHKTILTLAAFAVIGALLFVHHRTGMRGRKAARIVLLAYLLLSLGYPGVKFVTDVLIG